MEEIFLKTLVFSEIMTDDECLTLNGSPRIILKQ